MSDYDYDLRCWWMWKGPIDLKLPQDLVMMDDDAMNSKPHSAWAADTRKKAKVRQA
jgi:hypothetical protein